ncbi:MAG: hypothetical protein ACYCQJ_08940 [Nitrososphaerales archaeon]
MLGEKYGLSQALIATTFLKGAFFLIGVAIIGAFHPWTMLNSCSSSSQPVSVYQFTPWAHIEAYTDYRDLYLPCLVSPFLKGATPYHLNTIVYNYPPLFIYLIGAFAYFANVIWVPALPLVIFDILTAIPVYLIAKEFLFQRDSKLAFLVTLFVAANPINLLYNDLMWLNPGPTTFFLVLSIYFFLKEKWMFSSFALAISTGFKQISVILFPVLLILLWKGYGFSKKLIVYASVYFVSLVAISYPYIFNDSQNYFWSLNLPILGVPPNAPNNAPTFTASLSEPVRITTFLGFISPALRPFVLESYLYLDYALALIFGTFLIYLIVRERSKSNQNISPGEVLVFSLTAFLIFFSLFGRGDYKYYFASITPLCLPMTRSKFMALIFEMLSLGLVLAPREVTPWIAVLFLTFVPRMFEETVGADLLLQTNAPI